MRNLLKFMIFTLIFMFLTSSICKKKNKTPDTPEIPSGPTSGVINIEYNFTSSAIDLDNDAVSIRFNWGDGDTSIWSQFAGSGEIISKSHSWSIPDTYYISAQARDQNENISNWSGTKKVTIFINNPPHTPSTPNGPINGVIDTSYSFTTVTNDTNGDNVAIRFNWGDGTISSWSNFVNSGIPISMNKAFSATGTYYIKAQAKDVWGDTSSWSLPLTITIVTGWVTIMSENFESGFPGTKWTIVGSPTWDDETYRPYQGSKSGWCAGTGYSPSHGYVPDMYAWMVYGPFSLVGVSNAQVSFWTWNDIEPGWDELKWGVSTDGISFYSCGTISGFFPYWQNRTFNLTNVPGLGNVCGLPQVYIAFWFESDEDVEYEGSYLDNIILLKYVSTDKTEEKMIHSSNQNITPEKIIRPEKVLKSKDIIEKNIK